MERINVREISEPESIAPILKRRWDSRSLGLEQVVK